MMYIALATGGFHWSESPSRDAGEDVADDTGSKPNKRDRRKRHKGTAAIKGDIELTPAQRALQWRGPKVALPERSMDFASGATGDGADSLATHGRALTGSEINHVIQAQSQPVIDCIATARGDQEITAEITLRMLVNGAGEVEIMRVRAPRFTLDRGLASCLQSAVKAMHFPGTGAHTVVTVPYDLY